MFWKVGSFLLLIGLPVILFVIQYAVITATIPVDYTISNLFLNYSHPNATAMFATNYIHDVWNPGHVISNIASIYAIMFATFIVFFIVIPIFQMHNLLHFKYPDLSFFSTAAVLLFGLPFAVSGISIYFGRQLSQTGGWGFSGIVWGFYAYLFFLGLLIISDTILNRMIQRGTLSHPDGEVNITNPVLTDPPTTTGIALSLLFLNFVVVIFPIFTILAEIGSKKIGVFGHFAGFALGLFIAVLVMLIFERKTMRNRVMLSGVLLLVIAVPSVIWMIL